MMHPSDVSDIYILISYGMRGGAPRDSDYLDWACSHSGKQDEREKTLTTQKRDEKQLMAANSAQNIYRYIYIPSDESQARCITCVFHQTSGTLFLPMGCDHRAARTSVEV